MTRRVLLIVAYGGSLGEQIQACRALGLDVNARQWPPEVHSRLRPLS